MKTTPIMDKIFQQGLNVLITVLEMFPKKEEQNDNHDPEITQPSVKSVEENGQPHDIYYLRNVKMDEKLMYQLAPFINANRPQTPITKWQELKQQFGPPKDRIAPMNFKEICKQSNEMNRKFVIGSKWWK